MRRAQSEAAWAEAKAARGQRIRALFFAWRRWKKPALAPPNAGWRMVRLPDETVAYVPAALALSPVGYRATFWAEPDGTWFLRSFLAGD